MTLWEYLTAPTLTHAASKSSISAQVRPTGGRQNCVIPPPSSATPHQLRRTPGSESRCWRSASVSCSGASSAM